MSNEINIQVSTPPTEKDGQDRRGSYKSENIPGREKSSEKGEEEGGEGVADDHHHQREGAACYPAVFNNCTKVYNCLTSPN